MNIIFREDVLALGERYGLGEFVRYHQGPTLGTIIRRSTSIALFWLIPVFAFFIKFENPSGSIPVYHSPSSLLRDIVFICIPLWIVLMALTLFLQHRKQNHIYEFTGGIIEIKKKKAIHITHWDHMAALTYKRQDNLFGLPSYVITMLNGKHYTLYCESIIPSIEQAIVRRELPDTLTRYQTGATLQFGSLTVNKEGISRSDKTNRKAAQSSQALKWNEVRQYLSQGRTLMSFASSTADKPVQLSLYGVSNACVLRELTISITSLAVTMQ